MKTPILSSLLAPLFLAQAAPDLILHGGAVLTMDDAAPRASAVAVRDGRILAVGSDASVLARRGPDTELIDLAGSALLPGFVDAHGHVTGGGLQALSANLLAPPDGEVRDIPSLQAVLGRWMDEHPQDRLVVGFGYDNSQLAELRHPSRQELDAVTDELPVLLIHQSGHLIAVNSVALEIGGIDADTADPPGGVVQRAEGSREPSGVLEETAAFPLLLKLLAQSGTSDPAATIRAGVELWARYGYTTAQDGRSSPQMVASLRAYAETGALPIDVVAYPDVLIDRELIARTVSSEYRDRFRVAGAKLTIDGSPQGFTAWRDRPYHAPVGSYAPGYVGYAAANYDECRDAVRWAFENELQLMTHANGEAASDRLIALIDEARRDFGAGDRRPVLIHGQFLREDQVDALRRLEVVPSLFPMHTFYWGDWHREHTVGPDRVDDISPTGWCLARGMRFTTHHDAPVAFPNSMRVLDATVTRRSRSGDIIGPEHRVDVMTALKAMTLWPAWQHFEEDSKGSIEVGKLADLVVIDRDPTAVDPETLDSLIVLRTIKEGRTVYQRAE